MKKNVPTLRPRHSLKWMKSVKDERKPSGEFDLPVPLTIPEFLRQPKPKCASPEHPAPPSKQPRDADGFYILRRKEGA